MAEPFISREDVVMRLNNVIAMFKDQPVLVYCKNGERYDDHNDIYITKLDTGRRSKINVKSKNFCYRARRLGFFQDDEQALWLVRMPHRQQRCGIPRGCVKMRHIDKPGMEYINDAKLASKAMANCITGTHPGTREAIRRLENNDYMESVVISREFAVKRFRAWSSFLAFRGRTVGIIDHKTLRVTLNDGPDLSFINNIINSQPDLEMVV